MEAKSKRPRKQKKSFFVYLLRCRDNSLYCGQTNDLERRLAAHASGTAAGSRYTRSRLPVRLVYHESVSDLSHALKREYAIKSMTKEEKEKMVGGEEIQMTKFKSTNEAQMANYAKLK